MPSFATPAPISVALDIASGDVRLVTGERGDTVVEVRPSNPSRPDDVETAEQTRVEFHEGQVLVATPKSRDRRGRGGSIAVTIALPAGSRLHGRIAAGDVQGQGRLDACQLTLASGDVRFDQTGPLRLDVSSGDISVERVAGRAEVSSRSGNVRLRAVDGAAAIEATNGDTWVGEVSGDLQIGAANGDVVVERAHANVAVRAANGDVRLGEVARGRVTLDTASGNIAVGIREGSAAWLDVATHSGDVHNALDTTDGPGLSEATVEVRARTASGDISIRRGARLTGAIPSFATVPPLPSFPIP
jgi:DUF4097 and DUF4098 domain-containing protein YvlB